MRILAVDDDALTLQIVRAVVEASGHECLTAPDGRTAWEMVSTEAPDVVISDWHMPDMDGLELCRRIRTLDRYVYVVLLSGSSGPVDVLRGMEAGADDYLTKPLAVANLRVRLVAAERVTALHLALVTQHTDLERLNTELSETARTDPLTGLRNRRALEEDMHALIASSRRHGHSLSAVMLDVDHFKAYNDRFGHHRGDEALRQVAVALTSTARQADLFYRYGGEEFLCLFPQGKDSAVAGAGRLREAMQTRGLPHPDSPFGVVTFSAGVATLPDDDTTGAALVQLADAALYRAKAAGRNTVRD